MLEEFPLYYSGLIFKVVCMKNLQKPGSTGSVQRRTSLGQRTKVSLTKIAFGGRYDNSVEHRWNANVFACGVRVYVTQIVRMLM